MSAAPEGAAPSVQLTVEEIQHMMKVQGRTPEVFRILWALWLEYPPAAVQLMIREWGNGHYIAKKQEEWRIQEGRRIKLVMLWYKATVAHMGPKTDSLLDLAFSAKCWRDLQRDHPDWRDAYSKLDLNQPGIFELCSDAILENENWDGLLTESYLDPGKALSEPLMWLKRLIESGGEAVWFEHQLKTAARFEERQFKAHLEHDRAFFIQYTKALKAADDKIGTLLRRDAPNLILEGWAALGGLDFTSDEPTKYQIRKWIEQGQKDSDELPLSFHEVTWKRAWEDKFIAALFCD